MVCAILGAGAAGLVCAIRLKQLAPQIQVILLEKEPSPGRKLLATGNGRCNLSNQHAQFADEAAQAIFEKNGVTSILAFFNSLGLETVTDAESRIYPMAMQAAAVLQILTEAAKRLGVTLATGTCVKAMRKESGRFQVTTESDDAEAKKWTADFAVVCCGGKAQKNLGSDGSGYALLKAFGHRITPLYPALVQLRSPNKSCRALKGQRRKCLVSAECSGKVLKCEYGEVLFTDYGLSGIVIMDLSAVFARHSGEENAVVIDLLPDMPEARIARHFKEFGSLVGLLGVQLDRVMQKCGGQNAEKVAHICKNWRLPVTGTLGFDHAQITMGGADLSAFHHGLESKYEKNLFAAGEILNVQGPCGGFNLSWAFSSALTVAEEIAGRTK